RRLWLVLGVASLGDWLGLLATSIFAQNQVSTPAAKGFAFGSVIAVRLLPALVLGPLAGVLADRFDRRYTMVVCDVIRFVLFASIPAASLLTHDSRLIVGWAAAATFVIETAAMLWVPAKEASVPNLLPRARLETANQLTLATTFFLLFAVLFIGLGVGIVAGPRLIGALSRRRWFGLSIVLAAAAVTVLAVAPHLSIAMAGTLLVGVGAGMAFLSGTTLLGGEVDDDVRGRAFAVVQTGTRVVLMLTIAVSGLAVGAGGSRQLSLPGVAFSISSTRLLLAAAGIFGVRAGLAALRQMDDKPG